MSSASSYISTTFRSGVRILRRNAGRIALVTAVAGGAFAAAAYMRRQYRDLNDTLAHERRQGARGLRAAFVASSHTLTSTFLALLPRIGLCITGCAHADPSPALARLHERPADRAEKTALWQSVRDASLTALLAAVYLSSTLHTTLALQLHLLARYAAAPPDAPVQPLPAGPLRAPTSKRFLEASSKHVAGSARAAAVVDAIAPRVRACFAEVPLAKPLPLDELHRMLLSVLRAVAEDERPASDGGVHAALAADPLFRHADENATDNELRDDNGLTAEQLGHTDVAETAGSDHNLTWLVCEALDLCDVLAIDEVIIGGASAALAYAIGSVREEILAGGSDADTLPFAQLLGKLAAAAARVTEVGDGANPVEMVLRDDETCRHFAAAVFLSGEKQAADSGRAFGGELGGGVGGSGDIAVAGSGMSGSGSGDNLGLMFDMASGDNGDNGDNGDEAS